MGHTLTKPRDLADFIAAKRDELRVPRDEVAARAKRAGFDLSGSYIAKIEKRETDPASISVLKLQAIAAGLGVDPDIVIRIARGKPDVVIQQPDGSLTLSELKTRGGKLDHPPTDEEQQILEEAAKYGMDRWPVLSEPGFWSQPPADRRATFRHIEGIVDEVRRYYRSQGKNHA